MDIGFTGQTQQLRKRTPDKSGMTSTSTREQGTNYYLSKDLLDQDENLDLMTKKQRQGSPDYCDIMSGAIDNGQASTGSSETGDSDSLCAHVGKAVNLSVVKKRIINTNGGKIFTDCVDCKRNPPSLSSTPTATNGVTMSELYEFDDSIWICLRCGHAGCGRMRAAHAVAHNSVLHSDAHDLVVQTGTWRVWCYKCDNDVNVGKRTAKLRDAVEYLKKMVGQSTSRKSSSTVIALPPSESMDIPSSPTQEYTCTLIAQSFSSPPSSISLNLLRTRGLRNLGNTCFFNSVMQCLGQTPYLVKLIRDTEQPGNVFTLEGGQVPLSSMEQEEEDKERMKGVKGAKKGNKLFAKPLQGELKEWGPLARILATTLEELQSGLAEVYNPSGLLNLLSTKHPQFGRGEQQDAHELLRHLLEAVREEDLRRYQEVILKKHQFSRKTDPASIDLVTRKILKFYGSQADMFLPTIQVFKGILVSTLQCKDCGHTSHREEFFLDLSLPINEQLPKHRRKVDDFVENQRPSKYKAIKKAKNHRNDNPTTELEAEIEDDDTQNKSDDSDSDADVEDNLDEPNNSRSQQRTIKRNFNKINNNNSKTVMTESGYNSDSKTRQSPDSVTSPTEDGEMGVDATDVDLLSSTLGCTPHKNYLKENLAKLTLDCAMNGQEDKMELDSPQDDSPSLISPANNQDDDDGDDGDDDEFHPCQSTSDSESLSDSNHSYTNTPLGERYNAADGECSVQSCLAQFTTSELMMGANAVLCTLCTRRAGGKKQYRTALKQLLIYQPPPVLILHLKRFQVHHYHSTKLSKQVSFPCILDLAPFCSRRNTKRTAHSATNNTTTVQYALYGVVEHSGSIHGGHYVAYVKVRPPFDATSSRWKYVPNTGVETTSRGTSAEDSSPPAGRWYYVSDSHVQKVPEERVLHSQAYVLFYERII